MILRTLCAVLLSSTLVSAVQNVKVQGADFVNNVTSNRLQIIGVAYQPGGSSGFQPGSGVDPLSNGTLCLRDAALMQPLGVNTIAKLSMRYTMRGEKSTPLNYNLDPSINHDDCASIFNSVGIYMLIDVNSPLPNESLDPGNLASSYSSTYLNHVFSVVEAFHNYPNLLGFFSGNEVMNTPSTGQTVPPYLRAVTRDPKQYISRHSPRMIPVGYSAAEVSEILTDSWAYLSCIINGDTSDASRIDFFGLNSYSWCGPTSPTANYQASSYDKLIENFGNTSIPLFLSEYGCNKVEPRVFDEVPVLYGNMTSVMSGGLVYEYYQEESNNYGLVAFYSNDSAQLLVDYDNLQKQYNKLDVKALQSMDSSGTRVQSPKCSTDLLSSGSFNTSFMVPSLPSGGQTLIQYGISNPPQGKIVSISQNSVSMPVYSSTGQLLNNLAIKPLADDQSNTPDGSNTSGGPAPSGSSSVPSPSPTKGTAQKIEINFLNVVAAMAVLAVSIHC